MHLVYPSIKYKSSFFEFLKEAKNMGDINLEREKTIKSDFKNYINKLKERKNISNKIPQTVYWLIKNNEFIGQIAIKHNLNDNIIEKYIGHFSYMIRPSKRRHGYGKKMLQLGLNKAKEIGIKKVLICCNDDNIGSKKMIEYNGGELESIVNWEENSKPIMRYWIYLD